jgi:hypothetical protein
VSTIAEAVAAEPLFDCHEHQHGFSDLERRAGELDYREFVGYAEADVATALGPRREAEGGGELTDEEFFAAWRHVRTTGYGQATEGACRAVLGLDFCLDDAGLVTEKLRDFCRARTGAEVYEELLRLGGIAGAVNDACWDSPTDLKYFSGAEHPESFGHALRYDAVLTVASRSDVVALEPSLGSSLGSLGDLDAAMDDYVDRAAGEGKLWAMKCGLAYARPLSFGCPSREEASHVFDDLMRDRSAEPRVLQDYLFHGFVGRAADRGLPVQLHTGYLAGNYGSLANGDPTALIPVLQRYREVRFDLFHAGWPYCDVMTAIGKAFPNVWVDLCWTWAMNPVRGVRVLSEWLAAVPHNKILAYGGDTGSPFALVGYALQARRGITRALEFGLSAGVLDTATATGVARRIMHENARELYGGA